MTAEPPRRILFRAEAGAESPLWDEDGALWDLDDLPLTVDLRSDLRTWSEQAMWHGWPDWDGDIDAIVRQGSRLCQRVGDELQPEFLVQWDFRP